MRGGNVERVVGAASIMPGWIVQWYWNVPADENVLEKVPRGAINPELQAPPSALMCASCCRGSQRGNPTTPRLLAYGWTGQSQEMQNFPRRSCRVGCGR